VALVVKEKQMKNLLFSLLLLFTGSLSASDLNFAVTDESGGMSNGAIDMTITGGVAPYVYSWSGPSGFSAATEDISGLTTGTYTITVTDKYCGLATTTVFVDATTGIAEAAANNLEIFPNPGNSLVTITSAQQMNKATIRLINVAGVVVLEKTNISGNTFALDISSFANGLYFLELNNEGQRLRKTLVKK
jgi:hypothetical protein